MAAMQRTVPDLSGFLPTLPTPFDRSGNIDRDAFERHCARLIDEHANGLVVGENAGECWALTPTEHRVLIHIAVAVARGRVPVLAGAGSNSTAHAIELTHDAERLGANAVVSIVPYYNKPSQAGIVAHFSAIRRSTSLPIVIEDAPARCGVGLADATLTQLVNESDQFIGLKDSLGDVTRPSRLRALVGDRFQLLCANDAQAFAYQILGGDGAISLTANIVPKLWHACCHALRRTDMEQAQDMAAHILRLAAVIDREGDPVRLKCALNQLAVMSPRLRLPLVELPEAAVVELSDALNHVDRSCPGALISGAAPISERDHRTSRRVVG